MMCLGASIYEATLHGDESLVLPSRVHAIVLVSKLHRPTLRALAAVQPQSHGELASFKGLGPAKLARYGDDLLAVLATSAG